MVDRTIIEDIREIINKNHLEGVRVQYLFHSVQGSLIFKENSLKGRKIEITKGGKVFVERSNRFRILPSKSIIQIHEKVKAYMEGY